jgi:hypothetical protein
MGWISAKALAKIGPAIQAILSTYSKTPNKLPNSWGLAVLLVSAVKMVLIAPNDGTIPEKSA